MHLPVCLFILEYYQIALLDLMAVYSELLTCYDFEETLFVHFVVQVNVTGADVFDDLGVIRPQELARVVVF